MATITRLGLHGTPTGLWPFQEAAATTVTPIQTGRVSVDRDGEGRVTTDQDLTGRLEP